MRMRWLQSAVVVCTLLACVTRASAEAGLHPILSIAVDANAIAFSSTGKTIATTTPDDRTIRLWDLSTGKQRREFRSQRIPVQGIAFSADGKLLAGAGMTMTRPGDSEINVWNLNDGKTVHSQIDVNQRSDGDGINPWPLVAFSPDSRLLAYAGSGRCVILWDTANRKERHRIPIGLVPRVAAFSPDGRHLVIGTNTGESHSHVKLLDLNQDLADQKSRVLYGVYSGAMDGAFSADSKRLLMGHQHTWTCVYALNLQDKVADTRRSEPWISWQPRETIDSLAFSSEGSYVAVCVGGKLQLWNTQTRRRIALVPDVKGPAEFSVDGRLLAATCKDGAIKVWRVPHSSRVSSP